MIDEDGCFKVPESEDISDCQSFYNNSFDEYFDDFHNTSVTVCTFFNFQTTNLYFDKI